MKRNNKTKERTACCSQVHLLAVPATAPSQPLLTSPETLTTTTREAAMTTTATGTTSRSCAVWLILLLLPSLLVLTAPVGAKGTNRIEDLLAYATRARPDEPHAESNQRNWSQQQQRQDGLVSTKPSISVTAPAALDSTAAPSSIVNHLVFPPIERVCPGICRNILTASILCRNEISAPCPSFLQKCCDKDDVSFNGTPVETSAPLPSSDTDSNSAPLSDNVPQGQEQVPRNHQASLSSAHQASAAAAASAVQQQHQPQEDRPSDTRDQSSNGATKSQQFEQKSTSSSAADLLMASTNQPAGSSIYFLSSNSGSSERDVGSGGGGTSSANKQQSQVDLAEPAVDNEQASSSFKNPASQSFDFPVSKKAGSASSTASPLSSQVIVLQTANGAILHQPTERPATKEQPRRPTYANWTDYHMSMLGHNRPQTTSQTIVYHSNIDPAKKFAPDTNGAQLNKIVSNSLSISPSSFTGLATTIAPKLSPNKDEQAVCTGFCMPKIHTRFCQSQSAPNNQLRCENEHEFCCTQSSEEVGSDNSIRRTLALPTEFRHSSSSTTDSAHADDAATEATETGRETGSQTKVINDQHSAVGSKSRIGGQLTTVQTPTLTTATTRLLQQQEQSSPMTAQQPPQTTTVATVATTTIQRQASEGQQQPVESVGNVLVDLLDSWISGTSYSSLSSDQQDERPTTTSDVDPQEVPLAESSDQQQQQLQSSNSQQNDRRLGYDLSFRQRDHHSPNQVNGPTDLSGLMTSDGSNEQPAIVGLQAPESTQPTKCTGYCALPLFTMLCDSTYRSADCGPSQKCCVIGRPNSVAASDDSAVGESASQSNGADQLGSNGNNRQEAPTCRGSCLPVYHSSLCTKPNELQIDSPGCLPNFVCCNQPKSGQEASESVDDLSGLLNADSNQAQQVLGLTAEQQQLPKDTSFFVSLLPPPPPPLTSSISEQEKNISNESQHLAVTGRQRQSSNLVASLVQDSPFHLFQQQQHSTARPSVAKTTQSSGSGLMSHIYHMFKSSSAKQHQQRPQQAQQQQPAHLSNIVPQLYDPYQQLQASTSALRPNTAMLPQQAVMFPQHGLLLNAGPYQANPSYPPVEGFLAQDLRLPPSRNRFTPQQQQPQMPGDQQALMANSMLQKFNNQPAQQQQSKISYQPQQQMLSVGLSSFGDNGQQLLQNSPNPSSEQGAPSIMSFNSPANFNQQQSGQNNVKQMSGPLQKQQPQQVFAVQRQQQQQQQNGITFPSSTSLDRQRSQYNVDNAHNSATLNQTPQWMQQQPQQQPQRQNQLHPLYSGQQQPLAFVVGDANGGQQQWQQQQQPIRSAPATNGQPVRAQQLTQFSGAPLRSGSGQLESSNLDQLGGRPSSVAQQGTASGQRQNPVSRAPLSTAAGSTMSSEIRQVAETSNGDANSQLASAQSLASQAVRAQQQHSSPPSWQKMSSDQMRLRNNANDGGNSNSWSATRLPSGGSIKATTPSVEPAASSPQLPALSSSSSNLNVLISNGPFIDLQRVAGADKSATTNTGLRRTQVAAASGIEHQQHQPNRQQQMPSVPTPTYDLSGSSDQQQQPCPSSCLAPFVSFNCIKPNYIDDSYSCPIAGALCCVRFPQGGAADSEVGTSLVASSFKNNDMLLLAQQQSSSQPAVTISVVGSNKLDSPLPLPDQEDQLGEDNEQQGKPGEVSVTSVDSQQDSAASNIEEQSAPELWKNRFQATACGLPGPRGPATLGKARGRVMGGFDAKPGHWCWQAALMNNKSEYLCGGTLIGVKWVLTAAHCVTQHLRSESQLFVQLGQHNLNRTQTSGSGQSAKTIQVKTSYVHHNHNGITLDNDIALLRLEEPVDLEEPSVCLVCLPERSSQIEPGKMCTVTGYGFESEAGPAALRVRQTELPIMGDQECQNKTSAVLGKPFALPASSFCAGGELGQDACHGDGGSPLSCLVDGYYELTGIVSWGYKCGSKDLPGLYSKVSTFVGWINQIVSVNN